MEIFAIITFTLMRVAAGTFFAFSGFNKLFDKKRHQTLVETLEGDGVPFVSVNQWFVPLVELFGGLAIAFGFLTPLAGIGLLVICVVATCVDGLERIHNWKPINVFDAVDDFLYLPEVIWVIALVNIIAFGAGPYSMDNALGINIMGVL